jgi:hypothetical protein
VVVEPFWSATNLLEHTALRWLLVFAKKRGLRAVAEGVQIYPKDLSVGLIPSYELPPVHFAIHITNKQPLKVDFHRAILSITAGDLPVGKYAWERTEWEVWHRSADPLSAGRLEETQFLDMLPNKQDGWFRFTWFPPVRAYSFVDANWGIRGFIEFRCQYGIFQKRLSFEALADKPSRDATRLQIQKRYPTLYPVLFPNPATI